MKPKHCKPAFDMNRRCGVSLIALLCLLLSPGAKAAAVTGLYDAQVPVADRSERARDEAFGAALGAVAVRVSGRSDAAARLGALSGGARRYVQRYGYNGGLLDVGFDSSGVNQLLEQAKLPIWGRERPSVAVILPLGLEVAPEARMQVEQTARARGLPVVLAGAEPPTSDDAASLSGLAARYQTEAILVGRVLSEAPGEPVLRWAFAIGETVSETQGSLSDGVNFAADACARLYAVAPNVTQQVVLDVAGIADLDAYAKTLNYLSGLSLVRAVAVESVMRDVVRFKLSLRGDQEALRRTIALDRRLAADVSADAAGQLAFRYQP